MDFCDPFRHCMTLTVVHLTPKVDPFHSLAAQTTCANLHQNWFIRFQYNLFTSLVTHEQTEMYKTLCLPLI